MHQAQSYINQLINPGPGNRLAQGIYTPLRGPQAQALGLALQRDGSDYLYSGLVSAAEAIHAVSRDLFTWATVKLYYSTFYVLRAHLALEKVAIFYNGTKAYTWNAQEGQAPKKAKGQTHQVVLATHQSHLPGSALHSQNIGLSTPMDWLMARREEANYKQPRFVEPGTPQHFKAVVRTGLRRSLSAYISDQSGLYTFDPDHAMLALPITALRITLRAYEVAGLGDQLSDGSRRYIAALCHDRAGPLNDFQGLLFQRD